jgi:hypothetical protein
MKEVAEKHLAETYFSYHGLSLEPVASPFRDNSLFFDY